MGRLTRPPPKFFLPPAGSLRNLFECLQVAFLVPQVTSRAQERHLGKSLACSVPLSPPRHFRTASRRDTSLGFSMQGARRATSRRRPPAGRHPVCGTLWPASWRGAPPTIFSKTASHLAAYCHLPSAAVLGQHLLPSLAPLRRVSQPPSPFVSASVHSVLACL